MQLQQHSLSYKERKIFLLYIFVQHKIFRITLNVCIIQTAREKNASPIKMMTVGLITIIDSAVFISRTISKLTVLCYTFINVIRARTELIHRERPTVSLEKNKKKNQVIRKTNCFPECKIAVQRRAEFYGMDHVAHIAVRMYISRLLYIVSILFPAPVP